MRQWPLKRCITIKKRRFKIMKSIKVPFLKMIVATFILIAFQTNYAQHEVNNFDTLLYNKFYRFTNTLKDKQIDDSVKLKVNKQLTAFADSVFKLPQYFIKPLDSLKYIGNILSPDNAFRVYSWNIPLSDGTHVFSSIIQLKPGNDSVCKTFVLTDKSNEIDEPQKARLNNKRWYGALYYQVIPYKSDGEMRYVLLGMHFNNLFTNKKVIENMYFDEFGQPRFDKAVFQVGNINYVRMVFEYSINAMMSLKYYENIKTIVFDHLSPPSPIYNGNYKFYGPDFTFDGFKFEKGKWVLYSNIDFHQYKQR